jgi:hypothetical protein
MGTLKCYKIQMKCLPEGDEDVEGEKEQGQREDRPAEGDQGHYPHRRDLVQAELVHFLNFI